jgi:hypothetical protein
MINSKRPRVSAKKRPALPSAFFCSSLLTRSRRLKEVDPGPAADTVDVDGHVQVYLAGAHAANKDNVRPRPMMPP